jgi:hypothetical protein
MTAYIVKDSNVLEVDTNDITNKRIVDYISNKESELYGQPVSSQSVEYISENGFMPLYFFWFKPTKFSYLDDQFPEKITEDNYTEYNLAIKNPFFGWTKRHYVEFYLDVIFPKILMKTELDQQEFLIAVQQLKKKSRWWKNFAHIPKYTFKDKLERFLNDGRIDRKNDRFVINLVKGISKTHYNILNDVIKEHYDSLSEKLTETSTNNFKQTWIKMANKFVENSVLQQNLIYKYMLEVITFQNLSQQEHVLLHFYYRLINLHWNDFTKFIPEIDKKNISMSNSYLELGKNYSVFLYLTLPEDTSSIEFTKQYDFNYFYWFKKSNIYGTLTPSNFDYYSCKQFNSWTKKELLVFIDDLYTHVLDSNDNWIRDNVFSECALTYKKSILCSILFKIVLQNKDPTDVTKNVSIKIYNRLAYVLKQTLLQAVQDDLTSTINKLFSTTKYKNILSKEYNINSIEDAYKIFGKKKSNVTGDKPYIRYLDAVLPKYVLGKEEDLNPQPSEKTELESYNYISNLNINEKHALKQYQKSSFQLNNLLRFDIGKTKQRFANPIPPKDILKYIKDLRNIINNAPILDKDIVVYRGDSFAKLNVGDYMQFQSFLSTSISLNSAMNFIEEGQTCCLLEMVIPRDSLISLLLYTLPFIEEYRQEFEVLLINSTKWLITKQYSKIYNNRTITTYKLKFDSSNTNKKVFQSFCTAKLDTLQFATVDSLQESIDKCKLVQITPECKLLMSAIRLGSNVESADNLSSLCSKIQSNRQNKFLDLQLTKLGNQACAKNLEALIKYDITNVLGEGTAGKVYKACKCKNSVCNFNNCVAIKQTPVFSDAELQFIDNIYSKDALKYQSWAEITANTLVTKLIEQNICPNYVGFFHWFYCDNKNNIDTSNNLNCSKCVYIVNEVANYGTLNKWLKSSRSKKELLAMSFNVYIAIKAMQDNFGMIHGDLHLDNILVYTTRDTRSKYNEFILNGKSFFIPDLGYQFLISDFGRAIIPDKMEIEFHTYTNNWYQKELERYNIDDIFLLDWVKFYTSLGNNLVPSNMDTLLDYVYSQFNVVPQGYQRNNVYDLDKKVQLPDYLQPFLS